MQPAQAKYRLSEPSKEEKEVFAKEFQDLLNKHSFYFEPVPQFTRVDMESPWALSCNILIQKKIEIVEVEKESIKSDAPNKTA